MTHEDAGNRGEDYRVAIAASFTAEPVEEVIEFWAQQISLPITTSFAPYGQVFQELLDTDSALARNTRGLNVLLVRWPDLVRSGPGAADLGPEGFDEAQLRRMVVELADAVRGAAARWSVPVLVLVCPAGPSSPRAGWARLTAQLDTGLATELRDCPTVHVIGSGALETWYPGALATDAYTERLGHVPYTSTGFAAVGTAIVRRLYRVLAPEPKVVVVDADNTLWDGVAGEGAIGEVSIDASRQAIQTLLGDQVRAGRLLCLCSKNSPADTMAVIREHPGMRLRADEFTALRVNWRPKSENLRELASELGLGLDSFVFVDDSPVECAEVRDRCPDVAVLELPPDARDAERFLRHCWILDTGSTTQDDARRAAYYRTEAERERSRSAAPTLAGFLESLGLQVAVEPATASDVARMAQLTQRTNQFNLAGARRTETEMRGCLDSRDCFVVSAEDRFGSYGCVGAVIAEAVGPALRLETFLLSCRALGRGVEHRVLAALGTVARDRGLDAVELVYRRTPRNQPAADFVRDICGIAPGEVLDDGTYSVPALTAAEAAYVPTENAAGGCTAPSAAPAAPPPAGGNGAAVGTGQTLWLRADRVSPHLADPAEIAQRVRTGRSPAPKTAAAANDALPLDGTVAGLMGEVLGAGPVAVDADFFELGGTSLQLIGLMSRIRDRFGVELPMNTLYHSEPTARALSAAILLQAMASPEGATEALALVESMTDEQIEAVLGPLEHSHGGDLH